MSVCVCFIHSRAARLPRIEIILMAPFNTGNYCTYLQRNESKMKEINYGRCGFIKGGMKGWREGGVVGRRNLNHGAV